MKKLIIFATVIFAFCSCGPEPENTRIDYITKNISSHNVNLLVFYKNYNNKDTLFSIPSKVEIKQSYINQDVDCPFNLNYDSAYTIFDNVKQTIYRRNDGNVRNILNVKNYITIKFTESQIIYLYDITDEDYANAIPLK